MRREKDELTATSGVVRATSTMPPRDLRETETHRRRSGARGGESLRTKQQLRQSNGSRGHNLDRLSWGPASIAARPMESSRHGRQSALRRVPRRCSCEQHIFFCYFTPPQRIKNVDFTRCPQFVRVGEPAIVLAMMSLPSCEITGASFWGEDASVAHGWTEQTRATILIERNAKQLFRRFLGPARVRVACRQTY